MSYMKTLLEESRIHIVAISNNFERIFTANIKASSHQEAEIIFFGLMKTQKGMNNDEYKITAMNIRSKLS